MKIVMYKGVRIPPHLTARQKDVFKLLTDYPGSFLRPHIKPTGSQCYRLLDKDGNPIANIRAKIV